MALSATFKADFSSFYEAVDKAEVKLNEFAGGADKAGDRLDRMAQSFSGQKVVQEASLMVKAIGGVEGITKLTEKEIARLGATTNEAVAKLKLLGKDVPASLQAVADKTKVADKATTDWLGTLTKFAGAIGLSFSAATVINFGKALVETAGRIEDMSKKLGVSTDAVQRWEYAARLTGATMENVGGAVSYMSRALAGGGDSVEDALKRVGLRFADIRSMSPEAAFEAIAEAIREIPDPMEQARLTMVLFGKQGLELLPAIRDGMVGVGRQATIMSADTIQAFDALSDAWDGFSQYFMATVANRLAKPFRMMKLEWDNLTGEMAKFPQMAPIGAFARTAEAVGLTGDALEDAWRAQEKMNAETKRAAAETERAATAHRKLAGEIREHNQLWENRLILERGIAHFNREVEQAEDRRRAGLFQSKVAVQQLTDAEQTAFRHNALALFQRGDQILANRDFAVTLAALPGAQLKYTASVEESTTANVTFGQSIDVLTGAFAQLGQISGGAMGDVMGSIGQLVGTVSLVKTSLGQLSEGFANIKAGGDKAAQGWGQTATAGLAILGAYYSGMKMIADEQDRRWNLKVLRNDFIRAAGGAQALEARAAAAGVSLANLYAATQQTDVEAQIKHITAAIAFQDAALATLTQTAERYGFTLEELGPAFARQQLDKQAQALFKDWEVLNTAGIDTIAITDRMGESVSDYVNDAIKMGTEVPAAMRPMLQAFADSGQLLDENGQAITDLEGAGLDFTLTMSQGFRDLIAEVGKLTEAIARGLGLTYETETAVNRLASNPAYREAQAGNPWAGYVKLQHGTNGFRNFGAGTPAILHGWEAVVPRDDASATVTSGAFGAAPAAAGASVVINAQGAFFDTPESLQRLAGKVSDALTAKYSVMGKLRAAG